MLWARACLLILPHGASCWWHDLTQQQHNNAHAMRTHPAKLSHFSSLLQAAHTQSLGRASCPAPPSCSSLLQQDGELSCSTSWGMAFATFWAFPRPLEQPEACTATPPTCTEAWHVMGPPAALVVACASRCKTPKIPLHAASISYSDSHSPSSPPHPATIPHRHKSPPALPQQHALLQTIGGRPAPAALHGRCLCRAR
jgi:hypothetical protein